MTATRSPLPIILDEVEVVRVDRLTPSFVRVELGGACLADFGVDGPTYDQRFKLIFPGTPGGPLPSFDGAGESWWTAWQELPEEERGHMRTYTVRDVVGQGPATRLVVDIVVHDDGHGRLGPGCTWAANAAVGDRVVVVGPRRGQHFGGIEFDPGSARRLLLVGDETAVPAICAILAQLPNHAVGAAFLEVPTSADVLTLQHPEGVRVVWLGRDGAEHGSMLHPAVLDHLGAGAAAIAEPHEADPDLWETPSYSSSGEPLEDAPTAPGTPGPAGPDALEGLYAWIAGESRVVTALRRVLVTDLGIDRRQVAFMGYWRRGVPMRG